MTVDKLQNSNGRNIWQYGLGVVILLGVVGMIVIMMLTFGYSEAFIGLAMMLPATGVGALVIFWLGYPLKNKQMLGLGLLALCWGAGWAVFLAQTGIDFFTTLNSVVGSDGIVVEILPPKWTIVPLVEETCKAVGIILLCCLFRLRTKNMLAGIVIGACTGLGFSFMEDAGYIAADIIEAQDAIGAAGLAIVRSMTIATHASLSVLIGTAVGFVVSQPLKWYRRIVFVAAAWLLAVCVHGFLNYSNTLFTDMATSLLFVLAVTLVWIVLMFIGAVIVRYRYKLKNA